MGRILYSGGGEAYGKEMGRRTFLKYCEALDISREDGNNIITLAQENAKKFAIEPQELH